ncbi:major capsid protein [Microbacterium phage Pavlo]|nr:major capsid protein [Microbacterium phage Pavlo]
MAKQLLETLTRDGHLPTFNKRLNNEKLVAADKIVKGVKEGDNRAVLAFKEHLGARRGEAIHTTGDDFVYAFAQLTQFAVVNEFEAAERNWSEVIDTTTVSSFETPIDYSIKPVLDGFERPQTEPGKPGDVPPLIPEGSPYPSFRFSGERNAQGGIHKRGGRYDLTFEEIIRDVVGLVPQIPVLITEALRQAEEWDAWNGLLEFIRIPGNTLQPGETLLEETTVVNAPLSRAALAVALFQAENRQIDGQTVDVSSYNLLVPKGIKTQADFLINTFTLQGQNVPGAGGATNLYSVNGYNPLSKINSVVETKFLTGSAWALIPAKGAISGNKKFYALGQLVGHIGPELRLENVTGQYLGGGDVSPFEGDFETDSAAFRGRIIQGGLGWNPQYAVYSTGTGTA